MTKTGYWKKAKVLGRALLERAIGTDPLSDDYAFRFTITLMIVLTLFSVVSHSIPGHPVPIAWAVGFSVVEFIVFAVYLMKWLTPTALIRICTLLLIDAGMLCSAATTGITSSSAMFLINASLIALICLPLRESRWWILACIPGFLSIPYWRAMMASIADGVMIVPEDVVATTLLINFTMSTSGIAACVFYYVYRDLHSRRQLINRANKLEQTNSELLELQRRRDEFFGSVSHELLTPANAIAGITRILGADRSLGKKARLVEMLDRSTRHLILLINDTTDYRNLVSGELRIQAERFSLIKLIRDTVQITQIMAVERGVDVRLKIDGELTNAVIGDQVRIGQIIHNLLNNALKFTDEGSVDLVCRTHRDPGSKEPVLHIEVRDTGCGISEAARLRIFDVYFRENRPEARHVPGSGIGLYLCQALANRMGGRIDCQSEVGKGSVFTLTLPLVAAETLEPQHYDNLKKIRASVLIADDSSMSRLIVDNVLKCAFPSLSISHASDGKEAMQLAHERCFDIMIVDLNMPEFSGIEITRFIRQSAESASHAATIIGFTAQAQSNTVSRCLEAGMDEVVFKPLRAEILASLVAQSLQPGFGHRGLAVPKVV